MYVEHWIPTQVRHPYPVVLVHGGYGQGTDWMSTPDGRRGWASLFLEQGYKVYLVDRPGQGRNPHHPWVHGAVRRAGADVRARRATIGATGRRLTRSGPAPAMPTDPAIAQVAASHGTADGQSTPSR